jgi:hypothetical protein
MNAEVGFGDAQSGEFSATDEGTSGEVPSEADNEPWEKRVKRPEARGREKKVKGPSARRRGRSS